MARTFGTKYTILSSGASLLRLSMSDVGLSLDDEVIKLVGGSGVDAVFVYPGLTFDFTQSGGGADKVYLTGNFADYSRSYAGTSLTLSRTTAAGKAEQVVVSAGTSSSYDLLVFADGSVRTKALYDYTKGTTTTAPVPTGETSVEPSLPASVSATVKATVLSSAGQTVAAANVGVAMTVVGGNGVDTVYVKAGTVVDATGLGGGTDLVYFTGAWGDYSKSVNGSRVTFARTTTDGLTERVVVSGSASDKLIFADGAVLSTKAKTAIASNSAVALSGVTGFDVNTKTTALVPSTDTTTPTPTFNTTSVTRIASASGSTTLDNRITLSPTVAGDMTVEGWFKTDVTSSSTGQQVLLIGSMSLYIVNGAFKSWEWNGGEQTILSSVDSNWHHYAVTTDGAGTWKVLVDGVQMQSRAGNTISSSAASQTIYVGGNSSDASAAFRGQVSNVQVWDSQRTAAQISQDMNSLYVGGKDSAGTALPDLKGAWTLGDNTANQVSGGSAATVGSATTTETSTDDSTPTLTGTLSTALGAGQSLALFDGSSVVATTASMGSNGLSWSITPSSALSSGTHSLVVKVKNADGTYGAVISTNNLTVDTTAPSFTAGATKAVSVVENTTATIYTPAATDNVGIAKYALAGGADDGLFNLNAGTGALSFKVAPNYEAPASAAGTNAYTVKLKASDATGSSATQTVTVNVTNVNEAPIAKGTATVYTFGLGQAINPIDVAAQFSDPDAGDALTYSLVSGSSLPAGLTLNSSTGQISGTPTATTASTTRVTVQATDSGGLSATQSLDVLVVALPSATLLKAQDNVGAVQGDVSVTVTRIASASDSTTLDNRITLSPTVAGDMTVEGWFKTDVTSSSTGQQLFWLGSMELFIRDGALKTWAPGGGGDQTANGVTIDTNWHHYAITTDGAGNWKVLVDGAEVLSRSGGSIGSTAAAQTIYVGGHTSAGGSAFRGQVSNVQVWDSQRTAVQVGQDMNSLYVGGKNSVGTVQADLKGAWALGDNTANQVSGGSTATVGSATRSDAIIVAPTAFPSFSTDDNTPTLTGTLNIALASGQSLVLFDGSNTVAATANMGSDGLSWSLTPNSALSDGAHSLSVKVKGADGTYGLGSTAYSLTIDTTAPTFTAGATKAVSVAENTTATVYTPAVTDNVAVTQYTLGGGADDGLFNLNAGTGALSFKASPNYEAPASAAGTNAYTVKVNALDAMGNSATQTVTVNVTNVNEAPTAKGTVTAFSVGLGGAISPLDVAAQFSDPDAGDALTYSLATGSSLPAGLVLSATTGKITGTPTSATATPVRVGVTATDDYGVSTTQNFDISVVSITPSLLKAQDNVGAVQGDLATSVTRIASASGSTTLDNRITLSPTVAGDMTVEGWFKTDVTSSSTGQQVLLIGSMSLYIVNGAFKSWEWNGGEQTILSSVDSNWHHYAVTTDGAGTWKVLVDGVQMQSRAGNTISSSAASQTIYVGGNSSDASAAFRGQVSNVQVWDSQRTAAQISQDMNSLYVGGKDSAGTALPDLKGAWTLGDSTANQVSGGSAATVGSATRSEASITTTDDNTPTLTGTLNVALGTGQSLVLLDGSNTVAATVSMGSNGLSWSMTPNSALSDGAHSLSVKVKNSNGTYGNATSAYSLSVDTTAPSFTAGATKAVSVVENTTATIYTPAATDNVAVAKYTLGGGADDGLFNLDATTGALSFKASPNYEAPASAAGTNAYAVKVNALDAMGNTATQTVTVNVTNVNEAPTANGTVAAVSVLVSNAMTPVSVAGNFADVDAGDTLSFSLATGSSLPAGLSLNSSTGQISGTPTATTVSTTRVTVQATDSGGLSATQSFDVSVTLPTQPSAYFSKGQDNVGAVQGDLSTTVTRIGYRSIQAATSCKITLGPTVTNDMTVEGWFKTDDPYGGYYTQKQQLFWLSGIELFIRNGSLLTYASADGDMTISGFTLDTNWHHYALSTDGAGNWKVLVDGAVVQSRTGGSIGSTATAQTIYAGSVDSDFSNLIGQVSNLQVWDTQRSAAQVTQDMGSLYLGGRDSTGTVLTDLKGAWTLGNNLTNQVSGGTNALAGSVTAVNTLTVLPTAFPSFNTDDATPTLVGSLSAALASGQSLVLFDGSTVVETTASMSTDGLSWSLTPNADLSDGVHNFIVRVKGADNSYSLPTSVYKLIVDTHPPTFTAGATQTVSVAENTTATFYTPAATDNVAVAKYTLGGGADDGLFNLDSATNALSFKVGANFEAPSSAAGTNTYTVKLNALDAMGNTATQTVTINVTNVNDAPVAKGAVAAVTAVVGAAMPSIDLSGAFADQDAGDVLTYSLASGSSLPTGLALNSSTGKITGTPTSATASNITVVATDNGGLTATQTLSLNTLSLSVAVSGVTGQAFVPKPTSNIAAGSAWWLGAGLSLADIDFDQITPKQVTYHVDSFGSVRGNWSRNGDVVSNADGSKSLWLSANWQLTAIYTAALRLTFKEVAGGVQAVVDRNGSYSTSDGLNSTLYGSLTGTLELGGVSGIAVANGGSSNKPVAVVKGTLSAALPSSLAAAVQVYDGATLLGNATVRSDGLSWTYTDSRGSDRSASYTAKVVYTSTGVVAAASPTPYSVTFDTAPIPSLAVASGQDSLLTASETTLGLVVGLANAQAGNVLQLKLGDPASASNLGSAKTLTAADITAGRVTVQVNKSDLLNNANNTLRATLTDAAGHVGDSSALTVTASNATVAMSGVYGQAFTGVKTNNNLSEGATWRVGDNLTLADIDFSQLKITGATASNTSDTTLMTLSPVGSVSTNADGSKTLWLQVGFNYGIAAYKVQVTFSEVSGGVQAEINSNQSITNVPTGFVYNHTVSGNLEVVAMLSALVDNGGSVSKLYGRVKGTLSAALPSGMDVQVYDGATLLGNATVGSDGLSWSYDDARGTAHTASYTAKLVQTSSGAVGVSSSAYSVTYASSASAYQLEVSQLFSEDPLGQPEVFTPIADPAPVDEAAPPQSAPLSAALGQGQSLPLLDGSHGLAANVYKFAADTTAPSFTDGPTKAVSVVPNTATSTAIYTPNATDNVAVAKYTFGGGADDAKFNLNTTTGALTFKASPDFEAPGSAAGSNAYTVKLNALDAAGNSATQTVTVNVTNVASAYQVNLSQLWVQEDTSWQHEVFTPVVVPVLPHVYPVAAVLGM